MSWDERNGWVFCSFFLYVQIETCTTFWRLLLVRGDLFFPWLILCCSSAFANYLNFICIILSTAYTYLPGDHGGDQSDFHWLPDWVYLQIQPWFFFFFFSILILLCCVEKLVAHGCERKQDQWSSGLRHAGIT